MQQYVVAPNNFLIRSDGFLESVISVIKDAKRKKKSIEHECLQEVYKAFLKRMDVFYKSEKIEEEKRLFYLLAALVDCKKGMITDSKKISKK